jgi:6-phosphogluconolactonase (cycloisomerase 2 family)
MQRVSDEISFACCATPCLGALMTEYATGRERGHNTFFSTCRRAALGAIAALAVIGIVGCTGDSSSNNNLRAVFVGTNHNNTTDASQPANQIVMYNRGTDGSLALVGRFDTGGQGSGPGQRFAGDGLGAAHSVTLSPDRKLLLVTNAGSNNLTVFSVSSNGLTRTDLQPTGDGSASHRFPNSVTMFGNLVYVLNSADAGSITGFTISAQGKLTPIANSTRLISGNQTRFAPDAVTNPTQVSFTPDGKHLVVTIKDGPIAGAIPNTPPTGPGRILVFGVDGSGLPTSTFTQIGTNNAGPFGFSFDRNGNMLCAMFVGGNAGTAGAQSFKINADNTVTPIGAVVMDTQLDTCWLENNGIYAFGANYTSGTISSFRINGDGSLTLLNAAAGTTVAPGNTQGSTPLDLAVSSDGQYLYDVLPGSGKVAAWRINGDGSLTSIGEFSGLPQTVNGDAAPVDFGAGGSPAGIASI